MNLHAICCFLQHHTRIVRVCFNVFSYAMINVDNFSPKSRLILPHIVETSPPDVEISTPRALLRNDSYSIVKVDFIHTNPIDHHQFRRFPSLVNAFLRLRQKSIGREKYKLIIKYQFNFQLCQNIYISLCSMYLELLVGLSHFGIFYRRPSQQFIQT